MFSYPLSSRGTMVSRLLWLCWSVKMSPVVEKFQKLVAALQSTFTHLCGQKVRNKSGTVFWCLILSGGLRRFHAKHSVSLRDPFSICAGYPAQSSPASFGGRLQSPLVSQVTFDPNIHSARLKFSYPVVYGIFTRCIVAICSPEFKIIAWLS